MYLKASKQTKVMFTFSVTPQNTLCVSLWSNKCVCISFLLCIKSSTVYINLYSIAVFFAGTQQPVDE